MTRWLPSWGVAIWLAFFLALTCTGWRVAMVSSDGDTAYHWAHGEWTLAHRAVPRTDQFTHTRAGQPFVETSWLSEVAFAVAGRLRGWFGIVWLSAVVIATTLALLYRQMKHEGASAAVAGGAVLLASAVLATHWLARPHLATHLLIVIVGYRLWRYQHGQWSWMALPVVMLFWANLHSMFFSGLMLVGIYVAGNLHRPKSAGRFAGLFALGLAATLVNPNGWRLHEHIADFLRSPLLRSFAQECSPPNLWTTESISFWLLVLALIPVLVAQRRRVTATEWLLLAVWLAAGLKMRRNLPLFALVAAPILARHAQPCLAGVKWFRHFASRLDTLEMRTDGRWWPALAAAVVGFVGLSTELPATRFPVAAVDFLRGSPGVLTGEMFNDLDWGGYLMLRLPEQRVFIYSRIEDETLAGDYNQIDEVRPDWEMVCQKYSVGWTILPQAHPLNAVLAQRPDWRSVYTDAVATIYSQVKR